MKLTASNLSFGFSCPLKGASGGVKGVSGGILTSWSDVVNAYILSLIWPKIRNVILYFNFKMFEGGPGGMNGVLGGLKEVLGGVFECLNENEVTFKVWRGLAV